jgi:hypothetical protein
LATIITLSNRFNLIQKKSLIRGKNFFLHLQGHQNPARELQATLQSFFITTGEDKESAQCRFPARFQWLQTQLKSLPSRNCPALTQWLNDLAVKNITLVFPVAYLNNPASMFGHSFLKLDRQQNTEGAELLAWTINYAASTDQERGLPFVVKGLFGGYQGKFTLAPYYLLLKEYVDLDSRDLWEYTLNFHPDETLRLLLHLWELLPTSFDYYFVNKNCSYQLLALLEIARPRLNLTQKFKFDAIPADTVRVIVQQQGLLKSTHYRPALSTILNAKAALLSEQQQKDAKALAQGEISLEDVRIKTLSLKTQARVLELAFKYLNYLNAKKIKQKQTIDGKLAYELLAARSLLRPQTPELKISTPLSRPDEGHAGNRGQMSLGHDGESSFLELGYRWAYHGLDDNNQGFVKGAEVEFFKSSFRYYPKKSRLRLEEFSFINLTSLANYNTFLQPFSWQVSLGFKRMRFEKKQRHLTFNLKTGAGLSFYPSENSLISVHLLGNFILSPHFKTFTETGLGIGLKTHYDPFSKWHIELNAAVIQYLYTPQILSYHYQLKQRFSLSRNQALQLDLNRQHEFGQAESTVKFSWKFYF